MTSIRVTGTIDNDKTARAFQKAPAIMGRRLGFAVHRVAEEITRDAKKGAPKALTTLTNSIRAEKIALLEYIAGPNVDYADAVEEETGGGGWPSDQSIIAWMNVKNITPQNGSLRNTIFLIGRKIFQDGTPAQPYMEPATRGKSERLRQLVDIETRRGLAEAGLA